MKQIMHKKYTLIITYKPKRIVKLLKRNSNISSFNYKTYEKSLQKSKNLKSSKSKNSTKEVSLAEFTFRN